MTAREKLLRLALRRKSALLLKCRVRETLLRTVVKINMVALDDWLHYYAGDQCSERSVALTELRVFNAGGTLAYLADVQQQNRAALGLRRKK